MKKLHRTIILLAVLLIGINHSTCGQSVSKTTPEASAAAPTDDAKPVTATCTTGKTSPQNPDYLISINGKQNTVNITTDGTAIKAAEPQTILPSDKNSIEINGEGNSVSINKETTAKVAVKQNGNSNRVSITQTTNKP